MLVDSVTAAFGAGNEPLLDGSRDHLRRRFEQTAKLADRFVGRVLSRRGQIPRRLWRGTGGHVMSRLLSLACQQEGGEVTGHDHAHGQGLWSSLSDTIIELPFCDRFMVWSERQRELALRNFRPEYCLLSKPSIETMPMPQDVAADTQAVTVERSSTRRDPNQPISLMYVGTLYTDDFVGFSPLHPAPVLLDWEVRLFDGLKRRGYRVTVKPHPENTYDMSHIFRGMGLEVATGRFEDVCRQADVLLFAQSNSSSFFHALSTNMPIVLPNLDLNPWQPEVLEAIKARCTFGKTFSDHNNRLQTDWQNLAAAIARAPSLTGNRFYSMFYGR
jgi:hypothetical protein